jgi:hypothetical protein
VKVYKATSLRGGTPKIGQNLTGFKNLLGLKKVPVIPAKIGIP